MTRGILFLIEEARRLVLSDASADDVLDILAELNDNTKARLAVLSSPCESRELARGRALHIENSLLGNYWVVYERELPDDDKQRVIIFAAEEG